MTIRRRTTPTASEPHSSSDTPQLLPTPRSDPTTGLGRRMAAPHTREEVEETYCAARDTWAAAMRKASSGLPADLASLAIAQEAYEAAAAERARWLAGGVVAVPIEPEPERSIDVVVEQELAWRRVHATPQRRPGPLGRIMRRLGGRDRDGQPDR